MVPRDAASGAELANIVVKLVGSFGEHDSTTLASAVVITPQMQLIEGRRYSYTIEKPTSPGSRAGEVELQFLMDDPNRYGKSEGAE